MTRDDLDKLYRLLLPEMKKVAASAAKEAIDEYVHRLDHATTLDAIDRRVVELVRDRVTYVAYFGVPTQSWVDTHEARERARERLRTAPVERP